MNADVIVDFTDQSKFRKHKRKPQNKQNSLVPECKKCVTQSEAQANEIQNAVSKMSEDGSEIKEEVFKMGGKIVGRMFVKMKNYTDEEKIKSFEDTIKEISPNDALVKLCFGNFIHTFAINYVYRSSDKASNNKTSNKTSNNNDQHFVKTVVYEMIPREQIIKLMTRYVKDSDMNSQIYFSVVTMHELPYGQTNNNPKAWRDCYAKVYTYLLDHEYKLEKKSKEYCTQVHDTPKDNVKNSIHMDVEFM